MLENAKTMLVGNSVTLVNPNSKPWKTAYQGHEFTFDPFEEVKVEGAAAKWLLTKAQQAFANSKVDAHDSYQQYLELSSKSSHAARMMAERMLGPDGTLAATEWTYPPVINIDTKSGKVTYKEAKKAYATKHSEGVITDTGENVELLAPKEDWERDMLRDYIDKHYGTWQPAAKEPVLYQQALRLHNLQKATLTNAGKVVKEV